MRVYSFPHASRRSNSGDYNVAHLQLHTAFSEKMDDQMGKLCRNFTVIFIISESYLTHLVSDPRLQSLKSMGLTTQSKCY